MATADGSVVTRPTQSGRRIFPSTSVIVVMFNSESTLDGCLNSIPSTAEVVLVDQCSSDASVSVANQIRPDAKLIKAGANRGFGAGCNLGAANATGDVLIFLNPDASFGRNSMEILVEAALNEVALVGPRQIFPTGNEITAARYWSRMRSDLAEVFVPSKLIVGTLRRNIPTDHEVYRSGGHVPYVSGCCMAVSAENFWRAGGFDERFFLYHEEEVLARRLERIGVHVILEPLAVITHTVGNSTSQFPEFSASQYYRSKGLFYLSYCSTPVAFAAVIVLWSVLQAMAVLTPARKVVGLRADIGFRWYRAAAAGLISGWRGRITVPPTVH